MRIDDVYIPDLSELPSVSRIWNFNDLPFKDGEFISEPVFAYLKSGRCQVLYCKKDYDNSSFDWFDCYDNALGNPDDVVAWCNIYFKEEL